MNLKIDTSEHKNIIELYKSGLSAYKIADKYSVNRVTICNILKKYNQKRRGDLGKRTKDESYFENIDAANKAYWLGFLYADGYNNNSSITLSLQERDSYIVRRFRKDLKSSAKIYTVKPSFGRSNVQNLTCVTISSVKICNDLTKLGCVKAKSLIIELPTQDQVPDHLMNYFIKGYFDGDGCVHLSKHNGTIVTITSSPKFCDQLNIFLNKKLGINFYLSEKPNNRSRTLYLCGSNQIKKFHDYIYQNNEFCLLRKKKIFDKGFKLKLKQNKKRLSKKHSRFYGVSWHKSQKKWVSFSTKLGKTVNLGSFSNELDAAKAYDIYAEKNKKPLNFLIDKI